MKKTSIILLSFGVSSVFLLLISTFIFSSNNPIYAHFYLFKFSKSWEENVSKLLEGNGLSGVVSDYLLFSVFFFLWVFQVFLDEHG